MRYPLLFILLITILKSYAGDTLTRAEVYSFNIGDTFDYRYTDYFSTIFYPDTVFISSTYSRIVISDIYWSADSLTKYIVEEYVYPTPIQYDTLALTELNTPEMFLDTPMYTSPNYADSILVNTAPYWGRATNFSWYYLGDPAPTFFLFGKGLGTVIYGTASQIQSEVNIDTITLIYYSGDSGTYGTPYTSFPPTGVVNITANDDYIKVYPTMSDDKFAIEIPDGGMLPLNFTLYDIEGKKVKQLSLNSSKTTLSIGGLSNGIYIWQASDNEKLQQTGKIILSQ